MSDDPRPGTYASLDRRVTALEMQMADVKTQLAIGNERLDAVKATSTATHEAVKHLEGLIQQAFRDPYSVMPRSASDERDEWKAWRVSVDSILTADRTTKAELRGVARVGVIALAVLGGLASVVNVALAIYRATLPG